MRVGLAIGEVAKAVEVGVETVRFYGREVLIAHRPDEIPATASTHPRRFVGCGFTRRAKDLGFTLKEIGEMLSLRVAPGTTCGEGPTSECPILDMLDEENHDADC